MADDTGTDQRMKLGPSFRRDMRWAAVDIRRMTTAIQRTGPVMARVARAMETITTARSGDHMIRLVIANTHAEARRYCMEHDLDQRTMTVTPACSTSLRGISLRPEEVVNVCRIGPDMSDADYQRYLWLMEDVEAALRRGPR